MLTVGLVFPSTPLLAFTGLALFTTTGSSATSHRQETLSFLLDLSHLLKVSLDARLPQLLHWLPDKYATLKHSIGLTKYWASRYFGRLPTNTAETGYG